MRNNMILTVRDIIKRVRWCIDEEAANIAELDGIDEDAGLYMDNIIKAKVYDALRWCLQYASRDLLSDDGSHATSDQQVVTSATLSVVEGTPTVVTLPTGFLRLVRVRVGGWKKAVMHPIEEDSNQYLELSDATAMATNDRPVAALIRTDPKKLELWPGGQATTTVELTYVNTPHYDESATTDATTVYVPDKLMSAYLYYIAFLTLSAYGDNRAPVMLSIAKMNLGLTE